MFEDLVKEAEEAALQCTNISSFAGKSQVADADLSRRA
jgi:hypothetical protein